jgi:hypothetical protein
MPLSYGAFVYVGDMADHLGDHIGGGSAFYPD